MTRAFIITYNISGNTNLLSLADELYEDLVTQGHDIQSVKVYKEKSAGPTPPPLAIQPPLSQSKTKTKT